MSSEPEVEVVEVVLSEAEHWRQLSTQRATPSNPYLKIRGGLSRNSEAALLIELGRAALEWDTVELSWLMLTEKPDYGTPESIEWTDRRNDARVALNKALTALRAAKEADDGK